MSRQDNDALSRLVHAHQMDMLSAPQNNPLLYAARADERNREPAPMPALQLSIATSRLLSLFDHQVGPIHLHIRPARLFTRVSCTLRPAHC